MRWIVATCIGCAACSAFVDTSGLTGGSDDGGADAASDEGARADGAPDAAQSDAASADADASDCPGTGGPAMVRVGSYCIDATEVTRAQYADFLAAAPDPATQPSVCSFNTSFVPTCDWPAGSFGTYPVDCVDWCDARAFCAWAGKRLCGAIGGGATPVGSVTDPAVDQWYRACSDDGAHAFPYGDAFDPNACNGAEQGVGGPTAVESFPKCVGGYPGIFDMSGNVYEWTDVCNGSTGASDTCGPRGGGYQNDGGSGHLSCAALGGISRGSTFSDTGIRCCDP